MCKSVLIDDRAGRRCNVHWVMGWMDGLGGSGIPRCLTRFHILAADSVVEF